MSEKKYDSSASTDLREPIRQYLQDDKPLETADRVTRHRSKRYPYEATQWIAPYSAHALPDPSEFREVLCRNLSTGGFAFLSPQPPDFEQIVVRLEKGAQAIYTTARVIHTELNDEADGFLIGCQFTGRVPFPDEPSA